MLILAVIVFVLFITVAHAFAPEGYHWTSDTVSRLAEPGHPHGWILRTGMLVYGMILLASIPDTSLPSILISLYGIGIIFTGVFTVKKYRRIHMLSIYAAGAALSFAMFRQAIAGEFVSLLCLLSLITGELLFNLKSLAGWRGLSQRAVHLTTLIWLTAYGLGIS